MIISWDYKKNELLKQSRGVSFEQVVAAIETDEIVEFFTHPNKSKYPNQIIILINIEDYIYAVPTVIEKDAIILKTIYPSRKYSRIFLDK